MIRRLAVALVLVLVVTACGSSGEPTGFDQQLVPLTDEQQAAFGVNVDQLPVVERNFLEGCVMAESPRIGDVSNLPASCACAYDGIVEFYRTNATGGTPEEVERNAYESFKDLNDAMESEGGVIPTNIAVILTECAT